MLISSRVLSDVLEDPIYEKRVKKEKINKLKMNLAVNIHNIFLIKCNSLKKYFF